MTDIPQIISKYQEAKQHPAIGALSLRRFAQVLTDAGMTVSHQTVKRWKDGAQKPDKFAMLYLTYKQGWLCDFAVEILGEIDPAWKIGKED